ncbi:MAG TPA: GH3 auxin-responsive promoter family protein [Bacteroidales bacterium]|nr:GH3 auxin-responsive promoter family protein [Bacteroidales bacterium]HOR81372.1 GH3 auxin-responsive promoter family protein [Bacteroidales bacterium]HPJ90850.1 GH3 auxin-responsive promoter family protein [Bacteroidales bacterium]
MQLSTYILKTYFKTKGKNVQKIINEPYRCQEKCLHFLLRAAKHTAWGQEHQYNKLSSYEDFREKIPINTYQSLYPYIERSIKGERNVLWRGKTRMFSKSSGTSGSKSKIIPVTIESLIECNYRGGKDSLSLYVQNRPDTRLFTGKTLSLTGSLHKSDINTKAICGDVSAIIIKYIPDWANKFRTPPKNIALLPNWNEKLDSYAQFTKQQNITAIAGVPSWILLILKRIMEIEKIDSINEVWPNLELFMHGGVNFTPYYPIYNSITSNNLLWYWQIYNASEGYFATQDMPDREDMLLLLNNNVFYEFIPLSDFINNKLETIDIRDVKTDINYVLLVSTNAGLWRYIIGDVIRFTSTDPYRIIITGRTTHYINAFGEELIIDNAEKALAVACQKTNATVIEYTAAPIFLKNNEQAAHEWYIEFKNPPDNLDEFTTILDHELMKVNSDYEAKRSFDILLQKPIIHTVPQGTFLQWMTLKGKLGGQHKVIRLSNNRTIIEEIKKIIE